MAYVIAQPCIGVKDNSCVEVCPVDCIHSTDDADQYFINPDECIDCGVCAEVCPVEGDVTSTRKYVSLSSIQSILVTFRPNKQVLRFCDTKRQYLLY